MAEPHKFVDFASPFISSAIALTTIVYRPALAERRDPYRQPEKQTLRDMTTQRK
jgi:hypothetical protein